MTGKNDNFRNSKKNQQLLITGEIFHEIIMNSWKEIYKRAEKNDKSGRLYILDNLIRIVENAFEYNIRKGNKKFNEKQVEKSYWKRYKPCMDQYQSNVINKIRKVFEETPNSNQGLSPSFLMKKLWNGVPEFEPLLTDPCGNNCYPDFIVFNDTQKKNPTLIGDFKFTLHPKSNEIPADREKLKIYTGATFRKYQVYTPLEILIYISSKGINQFPFQFTQEEIGKTEREFIQAPNRSSALPPLPLIEININEPIPNEGNTAQANGEESSSKLSESPKDFEQPFTPVNNLQEKPELKQPTKMEWVGKIIQHINKPMRQGSSKIRKLNAVQVEGWLSEEWCHLAIHDRYFVAQHPDLQLNDVMTAPEGHRRRVLIQLNDFKDYPDNVAHEISDAPINKHFTQCWFEAVKFLDSNASGSVQIFPVHGLGMNGYKIRDLFPDEYYSAFGLPRAGIPIGFLVPNGDTSIQSYPTPLISVNFPVEKLDDEQVFYAPTFIVGRPGSGKTNTLKAIGAGALYYRGFASGHQPTLIFFDYEGQFASLGDPSLSIRQQGNSNDTEAWNQLNLRPIEATDVTVLSNISFSFKDLLINDLNENISILKLFLRTLPPASERAFDEIAKKIFFNNNPQTYAQFQRAFEEELSNPTLPITNTLNEPQRRALRQTLYSDANTFFDQPGSQFSLSNLIQPGKVLVFDLHKLPREKAILYVLTRLRTLKFETKNIETPIIVIIDEAHEVFKKVTGSSIERKYYDLISSFLAELGSRGRKYKLGLWLASQRPQDLHIDVSRVIVTHIILGLNPEHQSWLRGALSESTYVNLAINLPSAYALFKSVIYRKGKPLLIYLPRAPNFHSTFI